MLEWNPIAGQTDWAANPTDPYNNLAFELIRQLEGVGNLPYLDTATDAQNQPE